MATVREMLASMNKGGHRKILSATIERLRKDAMVKKISREAGITKQQFRGLVGLIVLTATEETIEHLKRELPWD